MTLSVCQSSSSPISSPVGWPSGFPSSSIFYARLLQRRVAGILWSMVAASMVAASIVASVLVGLGRSVPVRGVAGFIGSLPMPVMNGLGQSIWQCKVPADVQGGVFSAPMQLSQIVTPLAMLASGAMADHVFEPAIMPGDRVTGLFSRLVDTGSVAGMARHVYCVWCHGNCCGGRRVLCP